MFYKTHYRDEGFSTTFLLFVTVSMNTARLQHSSIVMQQSPVNQIQMIWSTYE